MYNIGLLKLYFKIKNGTIPLYFHNFLVTENVPVEPQRYNFRHKGRVIDLFLRPCLCFSIAINRADHVCATVIIKHNYMLMCNHKIVKNIMLCLLNSTGHI